MIKFTKICMLTTLILLALPEAHAGSEYQYSNVKRYYPSGSSVLVIPTDTPINPAGCTLGNYYVFRSDHPNYEEYKKMILSAKISGFKLGIFIYDDRCHADKYPELYRIFIQ